MSETEAFRGNIEWLGWDAPAIELVATFLTNKLSPAELARATVVVPTAESRRLLKEYMAMRVGRPVMMPHMVQPGHLVEAPGGVQTASSLETQAAWFKVMSRVADEVQENEQGAWFALFPKAPLGNAAVWVSGMAQRLMQLRAQMEQECLTERYAELIPNYAPDFSENRQETWSRLLKRMGERWALVQKIFNLVDEELHRQGLRTAEETLAEAVRQPQLLRPGSFLVLACVPELSPLNELFIRHAVERGQRRLLVLVNAPESEKAYFDTFGRPLVRDAAGNRVSRWLDDAVPLHMDDEGRPAVSGGKSVIFQAADAEDMGAKAVELAAGKNSEDVTVAVCDNTMAAAVHSAFLRAEKNPWCLNLPAGRPAVSSQEGGLAALLVSALETPHHRPLYNEQTGMVENDEPNMLEPLQALLGNDIMQQCYVQHEAEKKREVDLTGFGVALDEVFLTRYPSHMQDLVLGIAAKEKDEKVRRTMRGYVRFVCKLVELCSKGAAEMAAELQQLSHLLDVVRHAAGGSLLAEPLRHMAAFSKTRGQHYTPQILHLLLSRTLADASHRARPFLHREETHGDIVGWNELTFCRGEHLILCGMHDDCVPARPLTDIFLPDALRCSVGITSSESRTARDSFLLTALVHSHPGRLHFIVARSRQDKAPPAPSSLLLRCGQNHAELAERAAYLFREPEEVASRKKYRHWNLLRAPEMSKTEAGKLSQLRSSNGSAAVNPFAPDALSPKNFSASVINDFLHCPLRFWLKYAFDLSPWEAYPEDRSELKANLYGDLMHEVLKEFTGHYDAADKLPQGGKDEQLQVMRNEIDTLTDACYARYGDTSQTLLRVQKEQMKASLHDFARCHMEDLQAGWCVKWCEEKVMPTLQLPDGSESSFSMRLDRVDYNPENGMWRIVDYKSNADTPDDTHYVSLGTGEMQPKLFETELAPCAFTEEYTTAKGEKRHHHFRRTNVQLPLYVVALKHLCIEKGEPYSFPQLGYYNIPRGKQEACFSPLHGKTQEKKELTEEECQGFLRCALAMARLIRNGECLRSAESLGYKTSGSDFGALTPDDDPRSLCGMKAEFNS